MTFFNKKTEVMQIEMTPYGRYLYSIGKFKPHSYEFIDDDILYRASGSTETQESSHQRIINETPKLKINRSFEDNDVRTDVVQLKTKRITQKKVNQRQPDLFSLGRSSYSSDSLPEFRVAMLQGEISSSSNMFETNRSYDGGNAVDISGSVFIPQIDIDFNIDASLLNELNDPSGDKMFISDIFENGNYINLSFQDKILHIKEFNSFYERDNYEIEVFLQELDTLRPLKMRPQNSLIVNDILLDVEEIDGTGGHFLLDIDYLNYYFDIVVDEDIDQEILCQAVDKIEINNQFIDEELICPDQRTDRFDIYATRVGPEDLEDCD
tara:strand:+ start:336 stop:1304 length:969 start_codon:yes stop_codon:yes gene_type:complete